MRFILFNAIVGFALIYLFTGGKLPTGDFLEHISVNQESTEKAIAKLKQNLIGQISQNSKSNIVEEAKPNTEPNGFATSVIPSPKSPPVEVNQAQTSPPQAPRQESDEHLVQPVNLPKVQRIASRPFHTIDETKAAKTPIQERREEVLASGPIPAVIPKVSLKEGTSLMSTAERRRQLDSLAEEMELLYFEKFGG
jgi:hypothetical protein